MGRVEPRSGRGGEVRVKRRLSSPAHASPPVSGFARATLPKMGRGGAGVGRGFARQDDVVHHRAEISPNLAGRDPDDPKALALEDAIADRVVRRLDLVGMLAAVDLDDETPG